MNKRFKGVLKWADDYEVDLTFATIELWNKIYDYQTEEPGIKVRFYQSKETRENFRRLKVACGGKMEGEVEEGSATKAPEKLSMVFHLGTGTPLTETAKEVFQKYDAPMRDFMSVSWFGAYECKSTSYDCKPAKFKDDDTEDNDD